MLNKKDEPDTLRLLVIFLRFYGRMTQAELGKAAGVEQALVSRYESGQQPAEEVVKRMAKAVGIPWPLVMHLRRVFSAVIRLSAHPESETDYGVGSLERLLDRVLVAMSPHLIETVDRLMVRSSPEEMRREAEAVWANLRDHPMSQRRRLLDLSVDTARSWALAERLCDASLETADPRESLDLADLALSIAQEVEGKEAWRSRVKGYCWAHISHARRSANDAVGAESAAARAWDLWEAGEFADGGLLSETRMFELLGDVSMP
ncbi:MAG: helix-turn-helix domain-containing protein [Thermoanaerobaculia bacterium]